MDGYRFVVSYRKEQRSREDASATWRGWVEQVFPLSRDGKAPKKGFIKLSSVGGIVETMVAQGEGALDDSDS